MSQNDLEIRVELIEQTVTSLAGLPQQVQDLTTQFLQFREEARAGISAVGVEVDELRGAMRDGHSELRGEMQSIRDELRGEMRGMHDELGGRIDSCRDELRADMSSMHHDLAAAILAGQAQTRSLHEDLVERITLLGEGLKSSAAAPPPDGQQPG